MSIDIDFICDLDDIDQDRVFSDMEYIEHSNFIIKLIYGGIEIDFCSGVSNICSSEIKNFLYKIENNFGNQNISFNSNNGSVLSCNSNGNLFLQVYTCKECCFTSLDINVRLNQQSFDNFINVIKKLLNFSEKFENLNIKPEENEYHIEYDENGEEIFSDIEEHPEED
jgi:hypothetical protein